MLPAAPRAEPLSGETASLDLYLEVSVNRHTLADLLHFRHSEGALWLAQSEADTLMADLSQLPRQDGWIKLADSPDISVRYDAAAQRIDLTIAAERLRGSQALNMDAPGSKGAAVLAALPMRGVAFSYDLYGQQADGSRLLNAQTEWRTFGIGNGVLTSSFNAHAEITDDSESHRNTRLESAWRYDNQQRLLSLILGDGATGAPSWGRAVRFGGVTLSHNYTLRPESNTSVRSTYLDSVTLPSTVDLYVNGFKTQSQSVAPGQFTLSTAPTFNGSGQAQVVITDVNGQRRVVDLTLYGMPDMLDRGLSEWTLNLGWIRHGYATRSFDYDNRPAGAGVLRYGAGPQLTLEWAGQASERTGNMGVGAYWLLSPRVGVLNGSITGSRYNGAAGRQLTLGYQWNGRGTGVAFNRSLRSVDYGDLGRAAGSELPRVSDNLWLNRSFGDIGNIGLGWVRQHYNDSEPQQYLSATWSKTLRRNVSLSLSYTKMLADTRNDVWYLTASIPLGRQYGASMQMSRSGRQQAQWELNRRIDPTAGGWGWRAGQQYGDSSTIRAELSRLNRYGQWYLGYNRYDDSQSYYTQLTGALGWLEGNVYAMRQLTDGFALVDTGGVADIPVKLQNRLAGKTDRNGTLLLSELNSYQRNKIEIDPLALPADYRAPETEKYAVPGYGSGVRVEFAVYRARAVRLQVKDKAGQALAMGSPVTVYTAQGAVAGEGTTRTLVGYDGQVYLENPPQGGKIAVKTPDGRCSLPLPAASAEHDDTSLTETVCR